jgi:hypothetical protein
MRDSAKKLSSAMRHSAGQTHSLISQRIRNRNRKYFRVLIRGLDGIV